MKPAETFLLANAEAQERLGVLNRDDPWAGSPFEWIKKIPSSRTRGRAGELLAEAWLVRVGLHVAPPRHAGHDRVVAGHTVEVKFSTPWRGAAAPKERYRFQQIRDQDYEYGLLLGVTPLRAQVWLVPKPELYGRATGQHGGATGDVRWLAFLPDQPPDWLYPFGGEIDRAEVTVRSWLKDRR